MANEEKERICLTCGLPFPSKGPWNRCCPKCSKLVCKRSMDSRGFIGLIKGRGRKDAE